MRTAARLEASRAMWRSSLVLTGGRCVAFLATFCIPIVLARALEPAEFGTYKQLFLIHYTLYFVAQLGMAESLLYFLPSSPREGGRFVANATIVLAAAGASAFVVIEAAGGALSRWMANPGISPHRHLLGAFVALSIVSATLEIVLIARGRSARAAVAYGASDAFRAACLLVPALVVPELTWILAGAVAFAAARLVAALAIAAREFGRSLAPDAGLLRAQAAYAAPFAAAVLVETAQAQYHQFAVASLFDPATFAVYAVGCLQVPLADFVAGPACNVMMVRMREGLGRGDRALAADLWNDTTAGLARFVVPLVGALLVCGHDLIVVLFTPAYAASVPVFLVWACTLLASVVQTDGVLRVFAETRLLLGLSVLKLVAVAASLAALVAWLGLPGAALSVLAAMVAAKVVALARIRRLLGVGLGGLLPWRSLGGVAAVCAAAALPAALVRREIEAGSLVRLAATASAYAGSAAVLAIAFRSRAADREVRPTCAESQGS